jgi:hypothetical protein
MFSEIICRERLLRSLCFLDKRRKFFRNEVTEGMLFVAKQRYNSSLQPSPKGSNVPAQRSERHVEEKSFCA